MHRTSLRIVAVVAAIWLVLLVASHVVRARREPPPRSGPGVTVGDVFVGYREFRPSGGAGGRDPVLLLHGSPGSSADFAGFLPLIAREWRAIAPDLPGFGRSTRDVPDYSLEAHARYALALLDGLEIERAHVVGFSMGGGVALELAASAPERVRSVTLLSSIGPVEYELLGAHWANRAVHLVQLGGVWSARELLPHFGLLDGSFFGVPYARTFSDTDQRRLRPLLRELPHPTAVIHGEHDFLVPVAAARESARLVPQSRLVVLDASHFMVFGDAVDYGPPIVEFLESVEAGVAPARADADTARETEAAAPFDPSTVPPVEAVAWIVMVALAALVAAIHGAGGAAFAGVLLGAGRLGAGGVAAGLGVGLLLGAAVRALRGSRRSRPSLPGVALTLVVAAIVAFAIDRLLPLRPGTALLLALAGCVVAALVSHRRSGGTQDAGVRSSR